MENARKTSPRWVALCMLIGVAGGLYELYLYRIIVPTIGLAMEGSGLAGDSLARACIEISVPFRENVFLAMFLALLPAIVAGVLAQKGTRVASAAALLPLVLAVLPHLSLQESFAGAEVSKDPSYQAGLYFNYKIARSVLNGLSVPLPKW